MKHGSSRVGSGGVRNLTGLVGSSREVLEISRVGLGRIWRFSNITGRVG